MDKPPTEVKEQGQRLRQLVSDYAALFLHYLNVEGRPSAEAIVTVYPVE